MMKAFVLFAFLAKAIDSKDVKFLSSKIMLRSTATKQLLIPQLNESLAAPLVDTEHGLKSSLSSLEELRAEFEALHTGDIWQLDLAKEKGLKAADDAIAAVRGLVDAEIWKPKAIAQAPATAIEGPSDSSKSITAANPESFASFKPMRSRPRKRRLRASKKNQRVKSSRQTASKQERVKKEFRTLMDKKHHHFADLHESIQNGDVNFAAKYVRDLGNRHHARMDKFGHDFSRIGRRTMDNSSTSSKKRDGKRSLKKQARRLGSTKEERCLMLKDCVSTMTMYDYAVYFYSDDIDTTDGTMDDEDYIYKSSEMSPAGVLAEKKNSAEDLVADISDGDEVQCDELLQLFHRHVEYDEVPFWDGATVSQVCLASGTTVFVDLVELGQKVSYDVVAEALQDLVSCTEELYDGESRGYPFPFGGFCGQMMSTDYEDCEYNDGGYGYRIPIEISDSAVDDHGKLLTDFGQDDHIFDYYNCSTEKDGICVMSTSNFSDSIDGNYSASAFSDFDEEIQGFCQYYCYKFQTRTDNQKCAKCLKKGDYTKYPSGCALNGCVISEITEDVDADDNPCKKPSKAPYKYDCYQMTCDEFIELIYSDTDEWSEDDDGECKANESEEDGKAQYYIYDIEGALDDFIEYAQYGFQLIYGDEPSPGYVCGIKEEVVSGSSEMPGYCCLDAPYQLADDSWGFEFDCDIDTCQNYGPYLAGLTEESCGAHGGTFCWNNADCEVLKNCVEEMIEYADTNNFTAFQVYLEAMPTISNYTDAYECGDAREYFGFQATYLNDADICDEIEQLQYERDFTSLEEFFGQGSSGSDGYGSGDDLPDFEDPNESWLGDTVQDGQFWRGWNFALLQASEAIKTTFEILQSVECVGDATAAAGTICSSIKASTCAIVQAIAYAATVAMEVSTFTYGEMAELGNIEPMQAWEHVIVMRANMQALAEWESEKFTWIIDQVDWIRDKLEFDYTAGTKFAGCDGIDQDENDVADECIEDEYPPYLVTDDIKTAPCDDGDSGLDCIDKLFTSDDEAVSFLQENLRVEDDCAHPSDLEIEIIQTVGFCNLTLEVTPVHNCYHSSQDNQRIEGSTSVFYAKVDSEPPRVTCEFDPLQASETMTVLDALNLVIEEQESSGAVMIPLELNAADDCGGELAVEVTIRSNTAMSFSGGGSNNEKTVALFYQQSTKSLFPVVLPQTCGHLHSDFCLQADEDFVLYEFSFVAIDETGHRSQASICNVAVEDGSGSSKVDKVTLGVISDSSVRYDLVAPTIYPFLNQV